MSHPTPIAPPSGHASFRGWLIFLAASAVLLGVQLAHNGHLFRNPIHEESDYAANSLLVLKAKRLELLHGHYSRMGFYHPGPGLLYPSALSEWVLFDVLGVVPAPHNAHMIAHLFLNALLLAAALTIFARAAGVRAGCAVAVAFLVYYAREGHLASHWYAYTFCVVYLSFQAAAASVAAGRAAHLGWLALTAGLAVHSHASFVLFVVPISLYALARLWARGGFRVRAPDPRVWRSWALFAAVVGLFVLPIALHFALDYPGEIGRYLEQRRRAVRAAGGSAETARFMLRALTNNSSIGGPLAAGVGVAALAAVLTFPARGRRFAQQLVVVGAVSSGAMAYYSARGVDDYKYTYLGIFYSSVLLLGWSLIAMRLALMCRSAQWRVSTAVIGTGLAVWAATTGTFANSYVGAPNAPAVADEIAADPRWQDGPPILTIDGDGWTQAGAVLIQLERRGKRPFLIDPQALILFTDVFRPDDRPVSGLWQLDAAGPGALTVPARRVIAEFPCTTLRELETRCPLGPVPLGQNGRLPGAKPLDGWALSPVGDESLVPVRSRAVMLVDLDRCPAPSARLTVKARALGPLSAQGQRVGVSVNGTSVGELAFGSNEHTEERTVTFPSEVLNRRSPVRIDFTFPDAVWYKALLAPRPHTVYSVEITRLVITSAP
jgi:hypothetical protein